MCKSVQKKIGITIGIRNVANICNSINTVNVDTVNIYNVNTSATADIVDFDKLSFVELPKPPLSDRIDFTECALRGIMQDFGVIASERNLTNGDFKDFFCLAHIINGYAADMMKVIQCVSSYDGNDNTEQPEASALLERLYYYCA